MRTITIISFLSIVLFSCAKKITTASTKTNIENPIKQIELPKEVIAVPKEAIVKPTEIIKEPEEVVFGKLVFEAKCGQCHDLKKPSEYTAEKWVKIIDWMAPKAKLDATQKENVLAYVSYYTKK